MSRLAALLASSEARMHAVVALIVTLAIPLVTASDGSRVLAWSMFSGSQTYRVSVRGVRRDGSQRIYNPAALAGLTNVNVASFLAGADHFRNAGAGLTLRSTLHSLARTACQLDDLASTEVVLEERDDLDAPTRTTVATAECAP